MAAAKKITKRAAKITKRAAELLPPTVRQWVKMLWLVKQLRCEIGLAVRDGVVSEKSAYDMRSALDDVEARLYDNGVPDMV